MPVVMDGPEIVIVQAASAFDPQVAANGTRFTVVWERLAGVFQADVFAATYDHTGTKLIAPKAVDEAAGETQSFDPSISVTGDGTFVAGLWSTNNFPKAGARYESLGKNGNPSGFPLELSPDPGAVDMPNSGGLPVVAGLATGRFLGVWADSVPDGAGGFNDALRVRVIGSPPVAEKSIDVDTFGTNTLGFHLKATGLTNDGFAAAWRRPTGSNTYRDVLQFFGSTGANTTPKIGVPRIFGEFGDWSRFGDLASLPDGGAVYAWRERNPKDYRSNITTGTYIQRYDGAGGPIGKPITVNNTNEFLTDATEVVSVASYADGRFVVIWNETISRDTFANSGDVIKGQLFTAAGEPDGLNFEIATDPTMSTLTDVDAATLGADGFVAVYHREMLSAGLHEIAARIFDVSTPATVERGTAAGDSLDGTPSDDTLIGLGGNDVLNGLRGDDLFDGGPGRDALKGSIGSDTARYTTAIKADLSGVVAATGDALGDSFSSIENLQGSPGADELRGTSEANVIKAGGGDDFIDAGGRSDLLSGQSGRDSFYLDNEGDLSDTITDFLSGTDKIVIKKSGFTTFIFPFLLKFAKGPELPANSAATSGSFFFNTKLRRLYYDNSGAWVEFANLPGTASMAAPDIVFQ